MAKGVSFPVWGVDGFVLFVSTGTPQWRIRLILDENVFGHLVQLHQALQKTLGNYHRNLPWSMSRWICSPRCCWSMTNMA